MTSSFSDSSATKRQLTIKTGVVRRLAKEESSYLVEARQQEERIQKFLDEGRDDYALKQQRSVLTDTLKMIPDCRKRLELAADELRHFLEGLEDEEEVKGTEEFKAAKGALEDVQSQLQSPLPNV